MIKLMLKKIWIICITCLCILCSPLYIFAQEDGNNWNWKDSWWKDALEYTILPKLSEWSIESWNNAIKEIWQSGGHVMEKYNEIADEFTIEQQLATGIMNRNTIIDYLVYVVQFLSQIGLVIWAIFIIYAGYQYMLTVFNFKWKSNPKDAIKNAIIWVIIVVFSYAILKFFTAIFLWS